MKKHLVTRRDFLKQAAALTAATAIPSQALAPWPLLPGANPAQGEAAPGVPRNQRLILENPTGAVPPADDSNRWRGSSNPCSTGFQQLALDTLWYIDPDAGVKGVWDNALAA